jgi:hypothetical protein
MPKCIGKVEVHFLWTNFEAKRTLICGQREYACHYDQQKKYQNLKYVINITYSVGTLETVGPSVACEGAGRGGLHHACSMQGRGRRCRGYSTSHPSYFFLSFALITPASHTQRSARVSSRRLGGLHHACSSCP